MSSILSNGKKQWRESMKNAPNIKLSIIDLEEIVEPIDISINVQMKKATEVTKRPLKREKTDSVILFWNII